MEYMICINTGGTGAKLLVSVLLVSLLTYKRKLVNFFSITIVVYLCLMLVAQKTYDRYLLTLFPLFILFLLHQKSGFSKYIRLLLSGFVLFLCVYSLQFSVDFIVTNKYVWE